MVKIMIMINDQEEQVKVGSLKVGQLKLSLKKIQEIIATIKDGEGTGELISYFLNMDKGEAAAEGEEVESTIGDELEDAIFIEKVLSAFTVLFNEIPDDMTELIAIMSGIDEAIIDDQDIETLITIVETVIKENDIRSIMDRAKTAFMTARQKWGGLKAIKG